MDPLTLGLLISGGASLLSGFLGSSAATKASDTQAKAMDKQTALQAATIAQARVDAQPWMDAGKVALQQYQGELGLSATGANGKAFVSQFKTTPGYDFAVSEGEKGVVNNLHALGMGNSGAALKALTKYRMGAADQTYNTYLDRLSAASQGGIAATQNNSAQTQTGVSAIGQSSGDAAAARASGYVGSANAWTGALGNLSTNIGSYLGRQSAGLGALY